MPPFIKLMKKENVEYILDEIKAMKTINKVQVSISPQIEYLTWLVPRFVPQVFQDEVP
jgi:carbamoylphosphate synthase large subunit